jgi:adenosine/AMP kinase
MISRRSPTKSKPDDANVIIGQAHFIKTVDDLHQALVEIAPTARFGIALRDVRFGFYCDALATSHDAFLR